MNQRWISQKNTRFFRKIVAWFFTWLCMTYLILLLIFYGVFIEFTSNCRMPRIESNFWSATSRINRIYKEFGIHRSPNVTHRNQCISMCYVQFGKLHSRPKIRKFVRRNFDKITVKYRDMQDTTLSLLIYL